MCRVSSFVWKISLFIGELNNQFHFSITAIITEKDVIDLLNFYPFYVLQENRKADDFAEQFMAENLNTLATKLAEGNHKTELIELIG